MKYKITPKSLILSLLHASNNQAMPVKAMVSLGELFGFTGNTIRVTTTRLLREGAIENDERGLYRMSYKSSPVSRFVDSWRLGESRLVPWNGSWICCHLPQISQKSKKKSARSLQLAGFREGLANLWIRPNNLSMDIEELTQILEIFVIDEQSEIFIAFEFNERLCDKWRNYLWPLEKIDADLKRQQQRMDESLVKIRKMLGKDSLIESYVTGSETIHLLITDPLLPEEILCGEQRRQLTDTMLAYDKLGKKIWKNKFPEIQFDSSPSNLNLVSNRNNQVSDS